YSISNVGYGVAQVLPIIVEVLLASKNQWFSIQQPEVHLHPRAQAAFGEFVFNFFQKMRINFLIETHSDYIIDRFRSKYKGSDLSDEDSQVLFFQKNELGNEVKSIRIKKDGNYAENQPKEFREFFINEELRLLEI
ncbi:MAG: AAA family ATPase, partial [Ignavibacteria bacterium]|nr:AAA family ATPase [Ignavibacteria bacterium]